MASTRHVQLAANTVATVTLDANEGKIEVTNRDGTAEIYFTTDGSTPAVGGNNTHVLCAAMSAVEVPDETSGAVSTVKLISTGTPNVSVRGF